MKTQTSTKRFWIDFIKTHISALVTSTLSVTSIMMFWLNYWNSSAHVFPSTTRKSLPAPLSVHTTLLLFSWLACVQTALHADLTLHRGVTRSYLPVLVSSRYPAVCTPAGTEQNHFHSCCSLNVIKHLRAMDTNTNGRLRSAE